MFVCYRYFRIVKSTFIIQVPIFISKVAIFTDWAVPFGLRVNPCISWAFIGLGSSQFLNIIIRRMGSNCQFRSLQNLNPSMFSVLQVTFTESFSRTPGTFGIGVHCADIYRISLIGNDCYIIHTCIIYDSVDGLSGWNLLARSDN